MVRVARLCTEMLGTFVLAEGVCVSEGNIAVVWAVLWGAIIATGLVSGAQFNPAITTAVLIMRAADRKLTKKDLLEHFVYYLMHFVGAFLGALVSWAIRMDTWEMKVGASTSQGEAYLAEVFYTSVLILTALSGAEMKENNWLATLAVAVSVYLAGKTVGNISGACLNPAIGLGINAAAALHQQLTRPEYQWIYVVGPLTASVLSAALFRYIIRPEIPHYQWRMTLSVPDSKVRSSQFESPLTGK